MMAAYAAPNGVADCVDVGTDDEVCCGDDSCYQGGGPTQLPSGDEDPACNMTVPSGESILIRVGGWDTPEHTGNPKGEGRILFAYRPGWPDHSYSPEPCWAPHDRPKNRAVSFLDQNFPTPVGLKATLTQVSFAAECFNNDPTDSVGEGWWVTKPHCVDELNQDVTATDPDCEGIGETGIENIWRAQLTPTPVCHGGDKWDDPCEDDDDCPNGLCGRSIWPFEADDPADNCVHIMDCEIIPMASYELAAARNPLAPTPVFSDPPTVFSTQYPLYTPADPKCWSDTVGAWTGTEWTWPNQVVNMVDVQAAVFFFMRHPNSPHRTWPEINQQDPDMVVNFGDILATVLAFGGGPYQFSAPADCPAEVSGNYSP